MDGGINPDATLDYVEFNIFPSQNRYEASVWSSNREENVASGPLEQLLLHSPEIKNLSSKGFNTKFKILPPESVDDAGWFTTATLTRFLHIIDLPEILNIVNEMSQLEETKKFQLSLSEKAETDITTSTESKNELLLAIDLRLTALKEELAAAFNQAIGSKCSPNDISDLGNFALHFGSKDLRDSLQKSVMLSSTEDESSTFSSEEDQPSVERSRALTRSATPRRSASPMRRIQIGRSGSRRAAALSIKSLNYFPAREKSTSQIDAAGNRSDEEDSQRPPKNNVLRMSVQDKISLFESKQRDQGVVDIQKTKTSSNVTVATNIAVLKRWSSGMGTSTETSSPSNPVNVTQDGKTEPNSNSSKTETCAETSENISFLPEKGESEQLRVEADTHEPERFESCEKHPSNIEWSQQKGAELNELFMKLMETNPVRHQNMTSDNSKNKKKREEKLQGEAIGKRVEKDAQFKEIQKPIDEKKAKMTSRKVSSVNKKHASVNEPQKTQKNSTQLINSRTTKPSAVKKSPSKSSPLPATRKSWPSTPSPQAAVASPARTPSGPASTSSTPTNRKPHSAASVIRSSSKAENLQPRLKTLKATQPDANKRIKAINEKKQPTVTENRKMTKTNVSSPKPSFCNKVTRKSSVVPLETKPSLRKGSGTGPGVGQVVIKTKVVAQPEETVRSSGDLVQPEENKVVTRIDITSQNQEKECEMPEIQVVSTTKCEEAEVIKINTTIEDELEISPTAWVVTEENHQDEIILCKESPVKLVSPANDIAPTGSFSLPPVHHSLSQMLLEETNEADISEWGNADHPPTVVYQRDAPRGLKRLLKFARKAKADSHLTDWSSQSAFSEGEDDAEESKATRSFFSLSAFRGNKTNETKLLHR